MSALSRDEALLAELGYKQEYKRDFSRVELFGLAFSIIGVVQSISAVLIYAVPYGGPVSIIWGWAACSIFLVIVSLAMAELGSAAPTSGGLYYWTFSFCSPRYRNLMSWIVGYSDSIGYISGLAGGTYAVAAQILTAASLASEGSYVPTTGQIFGLYAALLVFQTFLACMATKTVARLQVPYMLLNILVFIGIIVAIPLVTPSEFRNDANFALRTFENSSLWPSGFAFIMAFLAPAWSVGGLNSSLHISEEAKNASTAVPFAMISSVSMGCILGWIVNLVVVFHMGSDMNVLLKNGQPMLTIIFNSFGLNGTLAVWSLIVVLLFMSTMDLLISVSRQMFAFSRDGALPFSRQVYYIHPRTKTPVIAVVVCSFLALLLGLLSFAGTAATGAIFTMSVVCQYIAYSIPIAARWLGGQKFHRGPFHLGMMSFPIAFLAVGYMSLMVIILLFPAEPAPDSTDMNYTVVVVGGILLLVATGYFFPVIGGKHWFKGPVANINIAFLGQESDLDDEKSETLDSTQKDSKQKYQ